MGLCTLIWVHTCVCTNMWRPEVNLGHPFLRALPCLGFETVWLTALKVI